MGGCILPAALRRIGQAHSQTPIAVFWADWFLIKPVCAKDLSREAVPEKLGGALDLPFPKLTPREASTAPLEGKCRATIGMRRAGKTTFLYQCLGSRLAEGAPRHRLVQGGMTLAAKRSARHFRHE